MPKTSIAKTGCVPGSRLQVQGSAYLPAASTIEFRNPKANYLYGSMSTTVDIEAPEFGTYRYSVRRHRRQRQHGQHHGAAAVPAAAGTGRAATSCA